MAARISEIFFYKESGKCFFYKEFKSNKTNRAGGRGGGVARLSDFFYFKRLQV